MKQSIQFLYKIFKLEADRGYDNRAVVGGLDRILSNWEADARLEGLPEEVIQVVNSRLHDYSRLSESSRVEALQGLWQRLEQETGAEPLEFPPADGGQVESQPPSSSTNKRTPSTSPRTDEPSAPKRTRRSATPQSPTEIRDASPGLDAPVTVLDGVGPRNASTLERLGLKTLRDMLYNFPRRYIDYSRLEPINRLRYGDQVTIIGTIQRLATHPMPGGNSKRVEAILSDGSGSLRITWFNPWVAKRISNGVQVSVSGKIDQYLGRLVMNNPEVEKLDQQQLSTNRIVPVYSLTSNITPNWMRKMMHQVISYWAPRIQDPLSEEMRSYADLMPLPEALLQIHFPDSWEQLKSAQQRLAFDEIFYLQLGVESQKRLWRSYTGRVFETSEELLDQYMQKLPYELTAAQQRALEDIRTDLSSGYPMNRLLQGDVGSGKTIIAALAVAMVTRHAAQAALMAPTSILAEQHYRNLVNLLVDTIPTLESGQVRLLIGSTPESEKETIRAGLADGSIKLVVGTHALIEDPVIFADLELAVVDEQHRFGVEQRALLHSKGTNPHLLMMTATPIPRSLALTVYGDLDLSVIDELPPGRQPVGTYVLTPVERERVYGLIKSQVDSGRQAFIIFPLVEESEQSEQMAAVQMHTHLKEEVFTTYRLGLLHGRLRPEEKDEVMQRFSHGEDQILVSTSVVEVGVDIPNATVMLVEGANRFGLAQLHQFRGRVGRGSDKAYCLLIPETADQIENQRLQVMAKTNDGFELADYDLQQRGPGEFLGTRQSGYIELQMASLTDLPLIEKGRRQARELLEKDPELQLPEHQLLRERFEQSWGAGKPDSS
ncbi:MAG: ATP-dependent DNA helicase RecG [Anaerolineales bacterium]